MPTAGLWNLEFQNMNSQRRYPLADDASGLDVSGSFQLPQEFLLEADLPVSAGHDINPARFFLKHVGVYASGYSLIVGYQPASGNAIDVATALIPKTTHVPGTVYALGGINDFADTVGKVVVGRLTAIDQQPSGFFTFTLDNARLDADCVRPILRCLSSIVVVSGTNRSQPLYGDIELIARQNIQLVPSFVNGQPQIEISAISGAGLAEECVCDGADTGPCIKTINRIPPTPDGDFTLLGNDCLEIDTIEHGLQLNDVCSKPCCGCAELESITRDLELFGSKAATLENFLNRLEGSVTQMDQVVLGTKLGDRSCGCPPGCTT